MSSADSVKNRLNKCKSYSMVSDLLLLKFALRTFHLAHTKYD